MTYILDVYAAEGQNIRVTIEIIALSNVDGHFPKNVPDSVQIILGSLVGKENVKRSGPILYVRKVLPQHTCFAGHVLVCECCEQVRDTLLVLQCMATMQVPYQHKVISSTMLE